LILILVDDDGCSLGDYPTFSRSVFNILPSLPLP